MRLIFFLVDPKQPGFWKKKTHFNQSIRYFQVNTEYAPIILLAVSCVYIHKSFRFLMFDLHLFART
jgi:hypothetical protein